MTSFSGVWSSVQCSKFDPGTNKCAYDVTNNMSEVALMQGITRVVLLSSSSATPVANMTITFKDASSKTYTATPSGTTPKGDGAAVVDFAPNYVSPSAIGSIFYSADCTPVFEVFYTNTTVAKTNTAALPAIAVRNAAKTVDAVAKTYPASKLANTFHWDPASCCTLLKLGQYIRFYPSSNVCCYALEKLYGDASTVYLGTDLNIDRCAMSIETIATGARTLYRLPGSFNGV